MKKTTQLEKILEERNKLLSNFEISNEYKNNIIKKENEERKNYINKNIQSIRNYKIYIQKENSIKLNIRDIKLKIKQYKQKDEELKKSPNYKISNKDFTTNYINQIIQNQELINDLMFACLNTKDLNILLNILLIFNSFCYYSNKAIIFVNNFILEIIEKGIFYNDDAIFEIIFKLIESCYTHNYNNDLNTKIFNKIVSLYLNDEYFNHDLIKFRLRLIYSIYLLIRCEKDNLFNEKNFVFFIERVLNEINNNLENINLIHVLYKLIYYTFKLDFLDKILENNIENIKYLTVLNNIIFIEINKFIFSVNDNNNNFIIEDENLLILNNLSLYILNDIFNRIYDNKEKLIEKFFEYFNNEKILFLKNYLDKILKIKNNAEEIITPIFRILYSLALIDSNYFEEIFIDEFVFKLLLYRKDAKEFFIDLILIDLFILITQSKSEKILKLYLNDKNFYDFLRNNLNNEQKNIILDLLTIIENTINSFNKLNFSFEIFEKFEIVQILGNLAINEENEEIKKKSEQIYNFLNSKNCFSMIEN